SVIRILRDNAMYSMLDRAPVHWHNIRPGQDFQLRTPGGNSVEMNCVPLTASSRYPGYVRNAHHLVPEEAVTGLRVTSSCKTLAYFPSCAKVTGPVKEVLEHADLLLFDGTFYRDDELQQTLGPGVGCQEMDHLPVSGKNGSLWQLAGISAKRRLYIHINNTNP